MSMDPMTGGEDCAIIINPHLNIVMRRMLGVESSLRVKENDITSHILLLKLGTFFLKVS